MKKLNWQAMLVSILVVFVTGCDNMQTNPTNTAALQSTTKTSNWQNEQGLQLISSSTVGLPVGRENYLFWIDANNSVVTQGFYQHAAIYGYDLSTRQRFTVANDVGPGEGTIVTDGKFVAWKQLVDQTNEQLWYMNLKDRQARLLSAYTRDTVELLALDQRNLYYADNIQLAPATHRFDLTTGQSQTMPFPAGAEFKVVGDKIIWVSIDSCGQYCNTETLHLSSIGGSLEGKVIEGQRNGCVNGFDATAEVVVYSYGCVVAKSSVYEYKISDGSKRRMSDISSSANYPVINDSHVAWTSEVQGAKYTHSQSLVSYSDPAQVRTNIAPTSSYLRPIAILDQEEIAFTVSLKGALVALYLISAQGVNIQAPNTAAQVKPADPDPCHSGRTTDCGQVRIQNGALADDEGPWFMKGVQFILPGAELNGSSFNIQTYCAALITNSIGTACSKYFNPNRPYLGTVEDLLFRASQQTGLDVGVGLAGCTIGMVLIGASMILESIMR